MATPLSLQSRLLCPPPLSTSSSQPSSASSPLLPLLPPLLPAPRSSWPLHSPSRSLRVARLHRGPAPPPPPAAHALWCSLSLLPRGAAWCSSTGTEWRGWSLASSLIHADFYLIGLREQVMLQKLHSPRTHPAASGILSNLIQLLALFSVLFPPKISYRHTHTHTHIFVCAMIARGASGHRVTWKATSDSCSAVPHWNMKMIREEKVGLERIQKRPGRRHETRCH